jgi:hypothetical protein
VCHGILTRLKHSAGPLQASVLLSVAFNSTRCVVTTV